MDLDTIIQVLDSTIRLSTPLLLACLAGLFSERAGIFDKKGYAYDDQQVFKSLRRLTALIRNANGQVIGAVGIGGNPITIPDGRIDAIGCIVRRAAEELSRAMGWDGTAKQ